MYFEENILGETWTIAIVPTSTDKRLNDCDGFCDKTSRRILVDDFSMCDNYDMDNRQAHVCQNIRHEIIHAFMFECGLGDDWRHPEMGHDETTVDWLAFHIHTISTICGNAEGELMMWLLEERKYERSDADQQD